MTNPYVKGSQFERDIANQFNSWFRDFGCKFKRVGMAESQKIVALGDFMCSKWQCPYRESCPISNIFWELANRDRINWEKKFAKALDDKQHKRTAILIGKTTNKPIRVMMTLETLLEFLYEILSKNK